MTSRAATSWVAVRVGDQPDDGRREHGIATGRRSGRPFRAVAAIQPEVVCLLHLVLLRRRLADVDAPPAAVSLQPFVQPRLCLAQIAPGTAPIPGLQVLPSPGVGGQP